MARDEAPRGRRAPRAAARDRGLTLVELLVVMVVFGIVITLLSRALLSMNSYASQIQGSADAVFNVRQALAQIDRQVRSGNVLYSPANEPADTAGCTASGTNAGSCMRVYTQANGLDRCVQWQVIADADHPGTSLLRSRNWSPAWQTDHEVTAWEIQARMLRPDPATAPFTLQTSGVASAYGSRLLDVRFEAVDPRDAHVPVVISGSVSGRNTNYGYDGGQCSPVPPAPPA